MKYMFDICCDAFLSGVIAKLHFSYFFSSLIDCAIKKRRNIIVQEREAIVK